MHCVLCFMSRLSIQEIKACHASMVQMLSYVETVDTLRSKHTEECIVCYVSCRDWRYKRSKHVMLQWCKSYPMSRQSIQNAYRCTHVSAHNFLKYSTDFQSEKSFGMLGIRAFQPYHQILYVDSVDRVDITSTLLHWNITTCIDSIDIYRIWWYGWKGLIPSIPKLFFGLKIHWILRKLWAETCGHVYAFRIDYLDIG